MATEHIINARPTKKLVAYVLTKDILLEDAILDLIDNSIDGAKRANPDNYSGKEVTIEINKNHFKISDNCGGIPLKIAEDYAFRFGRPDDYAPLDPAPTNAVGNFGVGMKRALLKMGNNIKITSNTSDCYFEIDISGLQDVMLQIIESKMQTILADINIGESPANKKQMLRMLDISYKDNAQMVTFGWLMGDSKIKRALNKAPAITQNFTPNRIEIHSPSLTFKEVNHLKSLLPLGLTQANFITQAEPVRPIDATRFATFYRYYPQFADIEE